MFAIVCHSRLTLVVFVHRHLEELPVHGLRKIERLKCARNLSTTTHNLLQIFNWKCCSIILIHIKIKSLGFQQGELKLTANLNSMKPKAFFST